MTKKKLTFSRYFTQRGRIPYDMFSYEDTDIDIADDNNVKLFTQNAEFPVTWTPLARKIVASKYFFGERETEQREHSIKQLVKRVVDTMRDWAVKQKYFSSKEDAEKFRDELAYLSLDQRMAFNSPVWFNVGVHKIAGSGTDDQKEAYVMREGGKAVKMPKGKDRLYPQTSACFIQRVDDTMEDIMNLAVKEALLFKYGSGTGTNLSTLRSSHEKLAGGGEPSGPLAYWAFYDKVAGIVKSGGKTRRAAKMDILNTTHPNIREFIESKAAEERKLHILIDSGIGYRDAQESVNYQNTNISIRATDAFMRAVENDDDWQTIPVHSMELVKDMPVYKAKELFGKIAKGTHFCGDPGMQFHDTINRWHTCPNSAPINASNPCSEYMFIDNSACNLASLNLMKFISDEGEFDVEAFSRTIRTIAIAQDLEIDNSGYPTKEIAENSHKFRPLGMGYANLGSLVMFLGLPYDSDEARASAAAITALETGKVYETSTEMAENLGIFSEYEKNKEPMLKVMRMHREALEGIDRSKLPKGLEAVLDEAYSTWGRVIERGERYGFRNAQATVLAPTGTIGFMMDADTKGIEPEIGLKQKKLLSDGGILELVNRNVEPTLRKLGYDDEQVKEMIDYVIEKETMEGAPHIEEEHLKIFDCSNKPEGSTRTISTEGHIKMMAAVQPFLSGAISKTVNMPKEATVEEIEKTYMDAWKMGLKSIAIYRDQSKRWQPLSFSKSLEERLKPVRRKLPTTSEAIRHKFDIAGHEGYLHVGLFEDGSLGEIFINMNKEGSTIGGLVGSVAVLTSMALQYGVPLEVLVKKFRNQRFEPRGLVLEGHPQIKTAESIPDYIFNYLGIEFLEKDNPNGNETNPVEIEVKQNTDKKTKNGEHVGEPGGYCAQCGSQMYKGGHCLEVCEVCGWQNPKGCGE